MPKLVIFDFDGTIADSFDLIYNILCEYSKLKPNKEKLRNLPTKIAVKYFNLSKLDFMKVFSKIFCEYNRNLHRLKSFQGLKESLLELKKNSHHLVLLTNSGEKVSSFLSNNSLDKIFDKIYYENPTIGRVKILNKIKKDYSVPNCDVYYIGDEIRDIIAAKKSDIKAVAVTWGYNDEALLREYKPSYVVNNPSKLNFCQ